MIWSSCHPVVGPSSDVERAGPCLMRIGHTAFSSRSMPERTRKIDVPMA
uniref:Uncharacterized protein n=1 Tax=Arundo donax TaxID=35708 RepID=A0A0A8Z1F0_ARUDO